MRYGLVICQNDLVYDVQNYSKLDGFDHLDETKLKDIVTFTNYFQNEDELVELLLETGLIPLELANGNLKISYLKSKNNDAKILQYGVSFKQDKKFFDTIFLKHYFRENVENLDFMKAFISKYYNYLKDISIFTSSIGFLNYSLHYLEHHDYAPYETKENMDKFVDLYCTKKSKEGFYKADFTRIRDLAMFAINFERRKNPLKQEKENYQVNQLEMMLSHYELLIRNNTLTDEEYDAYINAIKKIENELEHNKKITRVRSKENDITKN